MNNFKSFINKSAEEIEQEITVAFSEITKSTKKISPSLSPFITLLATTCIGGKYLRGTLVLLGYQLAKGKQNEDIKKIAAAFEILHTSLLIHDDIIDNTDLRRGKPTLHTQLGNNHQSLSLALCLGDLGFFLSQKLITDTKFDESKKINALSFFSQTVHETILGEILDVKLSEKNELKHEHDVLTIQKLKTAYYTIVGPLTIGAMLGSPNKQQLKAIQLFGEFAGTAFQIQDDILGIFGDEKALGKSTTSDIEENKNTLLIAYALAKANTKQKKSLKNIYGKQKINTNQHQKIKKIFKETGALTYSQTKAEESIEKAIQQIPKITSDKQLQTLLFELTSFIIQRQK